MRARLIRLADLTPHEEHAWRSLADRAAEPNPFFEPDCVLAAFRHLPAAAALQLAVVADDEQWYALLPVGPPTTWSRLHRPALMGRAETTSILQSNPLVDPAHGLDAMTALLRGLHEQYRSLRAGLLVFDWLCDDGPVAPLIRSSATRLGLPFVDIERWRRPAVYRRDDQAEYWLAALSHQAQKKLRQKRRRLSEELGPVELVDRSDDPTAITDFLRMEASGWKGSTPEGEAFARREDTSAYFTELCTRFASHGRLALVSLESAQRSVAMSCCLLAGEGMFGYRIGHDSDFDRFSPGTQIVLGRMEFMARDTNARWLDSCTTPDNKFLPGLHPESRPMTTLVVAIGRTPDRMFVRALPALATAKERYGALRRSPHVT